MGGGFGAADPRVSVPVCTTITTRIAVTRIAVSWVLAKSKERT
jgi:hypothetical protein